MALPSPVDVPRLRSSDVVPDPARGLGELPLARMQPQQPPGAWHAAHSEPYRCLAIDLVSHDALVRWINGTRTSAGSASDSSAETDFRQASDDVEAKLRKIWTDALGTDFADDDDFFDLGADSYEALDVLCQVEEQLHVSMEFSALFMQEFTLTFLVSTVRELLRAAPVAMLGTEHQYADANGR